jgi:hypothetical protein
MALEGGVHLQHLVSVVHLAAPHLAAPHLAAKQHLLAGHQLVVVVWVVFTGILRPFPVLIPVPLMFPVIVLAVLRGR